MPSSSDNPAFAAPQAPAPGGPRRRRPAATSRAILRLVLGGAMVMAGVVAVRHGAVPLVDVLFHPGAAWLSVVRRLGIFVAALVGYWAYVRMVERRAVTELLVRPAPLVLGGLAGALMVGLPLALLFALGAYEDEQVRGAAVALWGVAGLIGIAALLEELVYRALLFRVLEEAWGTRPALAVQALVFALMHLENVPGAGLATVLTMLASVTLLGLLWGGLFVLTRNLWTSVAHHAAWNFTILLSGVPLSGIDDWRPLAPLTSRYAGPDGLTGGVFGPESSWLVIATTLLVLVGLLRTVATRPAPAMPAR